MGHKELILFLRVPVPFKILYLYNAFQDSDSFYSRVSEVITAAIKKTSSLEEETVKLIDFLKPDNEDLNLEGISRGLLYLKNFSEVEITNAVGYFNLKQLQAVSVVEPDTVVATFFSSGKDELYSKLHPRT